MKQKFNILNEAVANAAMEEGKKIGLENLHCEKVDDGFEISYASAYEDKASEEYMTRAEMNYYRNEVSYSLKYMREDLSYMRKEFHNHLGGHLPAIKDAGKMEAALKTLGLGESFKVAKPTVWAEY